jgi:uncharacterized membrane protein YsdA (DUF1294 family)
MHILYIVLAIYAVMSFLTFIIYYVDKRAATLHQRRISERTLWLLGLFCGWPGAYLGQQLLAHKSSKKSFLWVFSLTVIVNISALGAMTYWYFR